MLLSIIGVMVLIILSLSDLLRNNFCTVNNMHLKCTFDEFWQWCTPMKPPPQSCFRVCPLPSKGSSSPFQVHLSLHSSPRQHWIAFCHSGSVCLYKNGLTHASGCSHSAKCLWGSFTLLRWSTVSSFLLLSSSPLDGLYHSCLNHSLVDGPFLSP